MAPRVFWSVLFALPAFLGLIYFYNLWQLEQYQFFVVLLAVIGLLFYQRWDRIVLLPNTRATVAGASVALLSATCACFLWSPWLAYFSLVMGFFSFAACCREKNIAEGLEPVSSGSLLYLGLAPWLCLRFPLGLDDRFIQYLQHITAKLSSYILDLLSIPHQVSGVIFELASGRLFVEEACSGVQSLFALLCVAMLLMATHRRPIILFPIYALAGVFSAILLNIVRVTSIALAQEWYNFDLAHGIPHDVLGYCCLFLAIGLLMSFDRLFHVTFFPISDDNNPLANNAIPNPLKLLWNRFLAPAKATLNKKGSGIFAHRFTSIVVFGLFLVGSLFQIGGVAQALIKGNTNIVRERNTNQIWSPPESLFANDEEFILEGFEQSRDGKDISQAKYVDIWKLSDKTKRIRYRIAISQPYDHFHDLNACYYALGWVSTKSQTLKQLGNQDESIAAWPFVYSRWINNAGNYAYLSYSAISEDGLPLPPPADSLMETLQGRLTFKIDPTLVPKNSFMFQIWTTLDAPLSAEEELNLQRMQVRLRERVLQAYQAQNSAKSVSPATVNP